MKQFWLIRHGQSVANAGLPTTDQNSTPLTERGHQQAQHVAQFFTAAPDLIVTSPYLRTVETAAPTRARFAHVPHEEWPVQEFTYLHPERYHNTTMENRRPHVHHYWELADPQYRDGGTAESFDDLLGRLTELERLLVACPAPFTAVFTHGIYMRAFLWHWLLGPERGRERMSAFPPFLQATRTPNASILPGWVTAEGHIILGQLQINHLPPELR